MWHVKAWCNLTCVSSTSLFPEQTTHTTVKKRPFLRDYLSDPVPEETFTHSHLWRRKRRIRTHNKVCFVQQGLLDPIKPAYNQSRPNGRLWLTASFLNCMPAVLLIRRTHCILYQLPPLLLGICWVLCRERWQRQMHRQSIWMLPLPHCRCPHLNHPPIFMQYGLSVTTLQVYSRLGQIPNNAGLHTQ